MANAYGGTVLSLDTTKNAADFASEAGTGKLKMQAIQWDAGADALALTLLDGATRQIFSAASTASERNIDASFPNGVNVDNFAITITGGIAYILLW